MIHSRPKGANPFNHTFTVPSQKIRSLSITAPPGFGMICVSGRSEHAFIKILPLSLFSFKQNAKPPGLSPRRFCVLRSGWYPLPRNLSFTLSSQTVRTFSITPTPASAMMYASGRSTKRFIEHPPFSLFSFKQNTTAARVHAPAAVVFCVDFIFPQAPGPRPAGPPAGRAALPWPAGGPAQWPPRR